MSKFLKKETFVLQQDLFYTGLTRAKRLAILVRTKKALAIAVKNDKTRKRFTALSIN